MKRLVILFMALLQLSSLCWSQELVFNLIDWAAIENNVNSIELNLNELKINNEDLQKQLQIAMEELLEQEKYSANQQLQYQTLENSYNSLKKTTNIWKIGCGVLSAALVAMIITEIIKE